MGTATQRFSAQDLSTVLDAMREGLQVLDYEFRYVFLNASAAQHGQRPAEELLGRTMMECFPGIEHSEMFQCLKRCMTERTRLSITNEFKYPEGQSRNFELRIEPCEAGILILSIDVTESRKLEVQFRHAQKMEAVGRLAGSVAHDFNNLLSVILSYSGMLLSDLKASDPIRADIEAVKRAGERAANLTKQLLAFSRQQVLAPQIVDLNHVIRDTEEMLRRLLGEDVDLVIHYARELAKVQVDPGQIEQVVMNLAVNARDAMPGGGKLTIETKNVVLDESYVTEHFAVKPGEYVMFAISDTGVGMDKETQAHIFEPFFTTKEKGKGTGLGLSTVFGIVQQSGGNVWVYSEPGNGTTFKIYIPKADNITIKSSLPPQPSTLRGHETILLVEDQDDVRQVATQILRRYGYHVLEARNAGEALLICERHPRTIQLLLTDVVMPQMSGRELSERLRQLRPQIKVLFMSGYTDNVVLHHAILESGAEYLQKPLVPDVLARRVRAVLDLRPPSNPPPPNSR